MKSEADSGGHFGDYGGNVNLTVNGQCVSENFLSNVPPVIGGVSVNVDEPNPGQGCGKLSLHGMIHQVSIGGQEFWYEKWLDAENLEIGWNKKITEGETQGIFAP